MRLIDADALIQEHCKGCSNDIQEDCKHDPICASMMWMTEAPTVEDAVVVVRCKGCINYVPPDKRRREVLGYCAEWGCDIEGDGYGYCYLGERKNDNDGQ